jgi:hypothetical protein
MNIPTDMVPLIHQLMELRLMTPTHTMTPMEVQPSLCKNSDVTEEAIIAAADWMEEQKKATGMSAEAIAAMEDAKAMARAEHKRRTEAAVAKLKSPTSSPSKKKRKTSAYQCFCTATIATMRERKPWQLAQLEENKSLWKYLGAKWQSTKLDELLLQKYTDQANHINNQDSVEVGNGEQVGTEESKEAEVEIIENDGETPEGHVEVEKVLAHWEHVGRGIRYLIKFVGTKDPEWVDAEHCACDELVAEYWERRKSRTSELYNY